MRIWSYSGKEKINTSEYRRLSVVCMSMTFWAEIITESEFDLVFKNKFLSIREQSKQI